MKTVISILGTVALLIIFGVCSGRANPGGPEKVSREDYLQLENSTLRMERLQQQDKELHEAMQKLDDGIVAVFARYRINTVAGDKISTDTGVIVRGATAGTVPRK